MSIEDKFQGETHTPEANRLSNEEFSNFIRDRASQVRREISKEGYFKLNKFEKEVSGEGIEFTPLQAAFLSLYFQSFSVVKQGVALQKRKHKILPWEKLFIKNIPYQVGFDFDNYLRRKDFSKSDILIIPCEGKGGIPFRPLGYPQPKDIFFPKDIKGLDLRTYIQLRDGNMHADGQYSFVLMDRKGAFSITSFDINNNGPVVKQIQGINGAKEELNNWPWETALFHVVEDWAGEQGYRLIQLYDPKEVIYTQLDPTNEHFVPLENISKKFEKVVGRRGLRHNGTRYVKELVPLDCYKR